MNMDELLARLSSEFPAYVITGAEEAGFYWLRADRIGEDWNWERHNMVSTAVAYQLCVEALTNGS